MRDQSSWPGNLAAPLHWARSKTRNTRQTSSSEQVYLTLTLGRQLIISEENIAIIMTGRHLTHSSSGKSSLQSVVIPSEDF